MAVTYVGETNASDLDSGQSTTALSIAAPAGSATDDLLIAFVHSNNTKGLAIPAGWTSLLRLNSFDVLDLWAAYRVKQASDTTWTWTQTTGDLIAGKMVAVRGANPGDIVTASKAQLGSTASIAATSAILTPTDGLTLVGCALDASSAGGGYTWSAVTSGFTAGTQISRSYRIMQAFTKTGLGSDETEQMAISNTATGRSMGIIAVGLRPHRSRGLFFDSGF